MESITKVYKSGMVTLDANKFNVSQEVIDSEIRNCEPIRKAIENLKWFEDNTLGINCMCRDDEHDDIS